MKKSLIALAALAFVGAAAAQSSLNLYGVADVYVGKTKGAKAAAADGGIGQSRLGFKGTEDLGGGLAATFNFEQGLNLGNGASDAVTFGRQANVGFTGGFGTIKVGRSTTALDDIHGAANSGFDSGLSATNGVWDNGGMGYTGRLNAQLYYATPEMAGFSGAISTQLSGNTGGNPTTSANLKYNAGPIYVGAGYEYQKATKTKIALVNASYDLGMAKLLGSYRYTKDGVFGANLGMEGDEYQVGVDVPLSSALTLSAGYAYGRAQNGFLRTKATGYGIALGYSLSKRTLVYGGYRAASGKITVGDTSLMAVGVNHSF